MKICFTIAALSYSGAEKVLSSLINVLKLRHEVSVILTGRESPAVFNNNGVIEYAGAAHGSRIARTYKRMLITRNNVVKNKYDIVVAFGTITCVGALDALMGIKIPLMLCERNDPIYNPVQKIYRLRRGAFYRFASGYVFQTKEIAQFFSESIQRRGYIIPNPIIDGQQENCAANKRRKAIATVARLDDFQKNHSMLFKAFSKFSAVHPEYSLEVYGDGPDEEKYLKMIMELKIQDKVNLYGRVDNPQEHIKTADIFVLTSNFEGMPNALIEAMSTGLPCISTDCSGGGAAALIKNNENGILIPINDEQSLVTALLKLSEDDDLKIKLGSNAYRLNQQLNILKIAQLWEESFQDCIQNYHAVR